MRCKIFLFLSFLCASFESSTQIDSNTDCAPGSLDKLNLIQLLESSNANSDCLNEARNAFSKNFNKTNFIVRGPFINVARGNNDNYSESEPNLNIILNNYDVILYILAQFGHLITVFSISFRDIPLDQGKVIIRHLNDNRLATIEWLYLHDCRGNVLVDLNAFKNVKRLIFASSSENELLESSTEVRINKLFPNLIQLDVQDTKTADWTFIDGNVPSLTELDVELPWHNTNIVAASDIAKFFKSNAQIDTLTITNTDLNILKEISANLPRLEVLKLLWLSENYLNYNGDPIHILSVEDLAIDLRFTDEIPQKITFDRLKTLSLNIMLREADKWTKFIANQVPKNLTEFNLFYDGLTYEQLLRIPEQLPKLRSLKIACRTNFGADQILGFLKKSKAMTHFKMEFQMKEAERNRLKDNPLGNWSIEMRMISGEIVEVTLQRLDTGESETELCDTGGVSSSNVSNSGQGSANVNGSNATNINSSVVGYSIQLLVIILVLALIKWL